jgi:cytochrome c biogenesis factor
VGFAIVVLLGTVFPLLYQAVNGTQVTVGTPYFASSRRR